MTAGRPHAALAGAAALLAFACSSPPDRTGQPDSGTSVRPPIIVISIDTLRSDRLPAYGYAGVETPAIDRLAAGGVLFERAYTHVNVTLPSHTSLFTGMLPAEHGVRDNAGYRLSESLPTLAAELGRHGYATGGFVSSYVLRSWTGLDRGFDIYDDGVRFETRRQLGELQRAGPETLAVASDWLNGVAEGPFFLFLHLYEPHAPYQPPEPFASRYDDAYDGEVAAADRVVGELFQRLDELGLYEDALIILLSDHGEGLMDHGELDHRILIYREVLQVPLIVKLPGGARAGERVGANVQLVDVAPTVYSRLGLERPDGLAGADLFDLPAGQRHIVSESVYPRLHFGWSDLASIIEGDLHFIDSPDPELFRLSEDPAERHNVIQEERAAARRLREALAGVDRTLVSPAEDDPETRQRLQSLGYLSGGARVSGDALADPKSRIGVVADLGRVSGLIEGGDFAEAEPALRAVLASEPQLALAWEQLGVVLEGLRRPQEALAAYREAFETSAGNAASAGLKVAELLLVAGRVEEAREHALAVADRSPVAYQVLAEAALLEGDLEQAGRFLDRAVAERGLRVTPLIVRAGWLNAQGRFEEALAQTDEVLSEFGDRGDRTVLARLFLRRGTALGGLARTGEAERSYREAIALDGELLAAYSSLAFLFALEGRAADAGQTLQEMVTANPEPAAYAEAVRTLRAMNDEPSAERLLSLALGRWPESPELLRIRGSG